MNGADLLALAAKLTKEQRDALVARSGAHGVVTSPEMDPLWFAIQKEGFGVFSIDLTDLGHSVRDHLRAKDGEA